MPEKINVKSVKDLGILFEDNSHNMVGQDGAYSIPVNGETLWFFGDTLIGKRTPGESIWYPGGKPVGPKDMSGKGSIKSMINNTGLIIKENNAAALKQFRYITDDKNNIRPLIRLLPGEDPDEIRIWCQHGVSIGEKIYLFFIKVKMIEEGIFPVNFELLGSGLAAGSKKDWKFRRITFKGSDLIWQKNDPKFASAVFKDEVNNMVYLYGVIQKDFVQNCYLARVQTANIENPDSYEYFTSNNEWTKQLKNAEPVFTGMPNELSVSYNKYLKSYLAVHSLDLTGKIVGRTAPAPWGPWSEPYTLYQVNVQREKELPYPVLIYAGKEHPELAEKNGKIIYMTYIEFEEYFPHLIEVELT